MSAFPDPTTVPPADSAAPERLKQQEKRRELQNRVLFGVLFAALVITTIAVDQRRGQHWGVAALAVAAVTIGTLEFVRLARAAAPELRLRTVLVPNLLLALVPVIAMVAPERVPSDAAVVVVGLALGWALIEQLFRRGAEGIVTQVGAVMLGIGYLGIPFLLLERLSQLPQGPALLLVFLAAVKLGDVTAFFGGKALGRHKMCPNISPGKTWEGFACSFIGAVGGSYLFSWLPTLWGGSQAMSLWWQPLVWGIVLGPLGVVGDLAESCLKRAAGRKDSGRSMPGFGGILDILDALIIAAPAAYLLAWLFQAASA